MNIQKMMQQAKEMQTKMAQMQDKLGDIIVEGSAGGGLVKVSMSCKGDVKSIYIDPSILNPEEKEIAEDLIKAALNDAKSKADQTMADETQKMMSDMGLPAGMQLPF
ncbi:MAG: YbaB/EbfC family nucleoid-associated protein [Alphaproteobacteria bacterium]|nr:YbaB/EbfC family nucleoid-associated protein [Alphaproteobacteria bacterium]NCQ88687.1 YbaB/EbfC family nucleoid-associated protein [Alphaproteobacteria bacterium]NCT08216.1 YbaB/EbfC family nucleoid-associated protein [Alphaproteobacteria bacterium]